MKTRNGQPSVIKEPDPHDTQQLELNLESLPSSSSSILRSPPKKQLWPILTLVMIGVASAVAWRAYSALQETPTDNVEEAQLAVSRLPIKTVRAELAPIQRWVTSPDSDVRVERYKQLIFETSGEITYLAKIKGRFLREGDRVKAGQLLARIDDREYTSNIRSAKAELEIARRNQGQAIASQG